MRPREFDTDEALERVMNLFWARGYSATTMRDLVEATGVHRASLYSAFGNKQAMFRAALDRYFEVVVEDRVERMKSARRARDGIESFIRGIVDAASSGGAYWGCLLVNTAVDLTCHDREVMARLERNHRLFEDAFAECVARAQREGDIDDSRDPVAVARFLVAALHGLQAMAKSVARPRVLADAAAGVIAALD